MGSSRQIHAAIELYAKILIVEDEQIVAHDIATSLRALGYRVTNVAGSAEEYLAAVDEELPDLA